MLGEERRNSQRLDPLSPAAYKSLNGHFVLMMQEVAVLLGLLAASVFHHSLFLRRLPSSLFECWIESSDPGGPPFFPPSPIILWQVILDRGTVDSLIIASASSWMSSKLVMVWFVWTQAGGSLPA